MKKLVREWKEMPVALFEMVERCFCTDGQTTYSGSHKQPVSGASDLPNMKQSTYLFDNELW